MRLEQLIPAGTLLIFDFEGSLAPQKRHANVSPLLQGKLKVLDELFPLAIFSGLPLQELRERLGFTPRFLVGDHGLEGLPGWESQLKALREIPIRWREQIESKPELLPIHSGVYLENRRFSLALHYRSTARKYLARRQILKTVLRLDPIPRVLTGKCVVNLIPDAAPGRALALDELVRWSGASHSLLIGAGAASTDFHFGHPANMHLYPLKKMGRRSQLDRLLNDLIQVGQERRRGTEAPLPKDERVRKLDQFFSRSV